MNWEAIGVIVEAVGAFAVLITLIYLSIQTRLTRKAVEESSEHATQQATHASVGMYSELRRTLLASPELAEVLVRSRNGEALTEKEQVLYSAYFEELFFAGATTYRSVMHHTADSGPISVTHLLGVLSANPRAIEERHNLSNILAGISSDFVNAIDRSLEEQSMPNQALNTDP